jgi:hypothetical protein
MVGTCNLGLESGVLHRNYSSLGGRDQQQSACATTGLWGATRNSMQEQSYHLAEKEKEMIQNKD